MFCKVSVILLFPFRKLSVTLVDHIVMFAGNVNYDDSIAITSDRVAMARFIKKTKKSP